MPRHEQSQPPQPRQIAPGVHLLATGRRLHGSNVYLVRSASSFVVVDTSWRGTGRQIVEAARCLFGADTRPEAVLLTHLHPDHAGSARELAAEWDLPAHVHPDEMPLAGGGVVAAYAMPLDRWLVAPLVHVLPGRLRERVRAAGDLSDVVRPLDPAAAPPGLPDWVCVPSPGHTPGHLAFFRPSDRVLLTGDALLTVDLTTLTDLVRQRPRLAGPPGLTTWSRRAAADSVARLAALMPLVIGPGHGEPVATAATPDAVRSLAARLAAALAAADAPARDRRLAPGFLGPVDYSGRTRYRRPPRSYLSLQRLAPLLTRLGIGPAYVVTLEVPGRRTGEIRRTTLVRVEDGDEHYLVALAGESEWVRNVRAARGRAVVGRRRRHAATLEEVPAQDRARIIRAYLLRSGRRPGSRPVTQEARRYFGISAEPTLEEIAPVVGHYPVFRIVRDPAVGTPAVAEQVQGRRSGHHYALPT